MKKYLIALLFVCNSYLSAASWSPVATIPLPLGNTGALQDVVMAYYPKTKQVVAAWVNLADSLPYYSLYNGTSWTTGQPLLVSNTFTASDNVNLQSFPKLQIIVAAWGTNNTNQSLYSIFDGTNWSSPSNIDPVNSHPVFTEIKMAYDKLNNRIIAAWADANSLRPIYATLPMSLVWTTDDFLTSDPTVQVYENINLIYNKMDQTVVATWANPAFFPSRPPYYSTFNVVTSPSSPIAWTTPTPIVDTNGSGVLQDVQLVTAPGTPAVFAFYGEFPTSPIPQQPPITTTYIGGTFSNAAIFSGGSLVPCASEVVAGVLRNIGSENIDTSQIFSAWACQTSLAPVYTIISLPSSIVGGPIPNSPNGAKDNVNLKYDQNSKQMIAAWVDSTNNAVYYSIYQ